MDAVVLINMKLKNLSLHLAAPFQKTVPTLSSSTVAPLDKNFFQRVLRGQSMKGDCTMIKTRILTKSSSHPSDSQKPAEQHF